MLPGIVLLIAGGGASYILYSVYKANFDSPSDDRYRPNVLASAIVMAIAFYGVFGGLLLVARSF